VIVVANSPRRSSRRRHSYAKAPPLFTAGGMAVFGLGGLIGRQVANMAGRAYEGMNPTTTPAPALPSGITTLAQYNDLVQSVKPTLARTGIELGISVAGFFLGFLAPWPLLKLAMYGFGFGALFDIGGALLDGYLVIPMFVTAAANSTSSPTLSTYGQMMYQHEFTAQNAAATAATAGGATLGERPASGQVQQVSRAGTPVVAAARPAPQLQAAPQRLQSLASVARASARDLAPAALGQPATRMGVPGTGIPTAANPGLSAQMAALSGVPGTAPTVNTATYTRGAPPGGSGGGGTTTMPSGCAPDCTCGTCQGRTVTTGEPPEEFSSALIESMFRGQTSQPARRRWSRAAA
jgi:hypothetical protein